MKRCFILDANVLMKAKNFEYAFDICPGFWELLERGFRHGCIESHEKVRDEIMAGNDNLKEWVADLQESYFPEATEAEVGKYLEMCQWAKERGYTPEAIREFESTEKADAMLCAKACVQKLTMVTLEKPDPKRLRKIKIPDVCVAFGVEAILTHDFVRELKAAFYLPENHIFDDSLNRTTLF